MEKVPTYTNTKKENSKTKKRLPEEKIANLSVVESAKEKTYKDSQELFLESIISVLEVKSSVDDTRKSLKEAFEKGGQIAFIITSNADIILSHANEYHFEILIKNGIPSTDLLCQGRIFKYISGQHKGECNFIVQGSGSNQGYNRVLTRDGWWNIIKEKIISYLK